jgi:hypothetical protein
MFRQNVSRTDHKIYHLATPVADRQCIRGRTGGKSEFYNASGPSLRRGGLTSGPGDLRLVPNRPFARQTARPRVHCALCTVHCRPVLFLSTIGEGRWNRNTRQCNARQCKARQGNRDDQVKEHWGQDVAIADAVCRQSDGLTFLSFLANAFLISILSNALDGRPARSRPFRVGDRSDLGLCRSPPIVPEIRGTPESLGRSRSPFSCT